jgi:endosialidase-like protein
MDLQTIPGIEHSSVSGAKNLGRARSRVAGGAILGFVALLIAQAPAWSGPSLSGQYATEQGWPNELLRQAERDARTAAEAEVSCGGTCTLGDENELKAFVDQWEKLRTIPRIEIPRLPPGVFRSKRPPDQRDASKQQSPAGWSKGIALGESSGSACVNQPCPCGSRGGNCGLGALSSSDGPFVLKGRKKFKIDGALVSGSSEPGGPLRVLSYTSESGGPDNGPRGTQGQGSGAQYTGSQGGSRTEGGEEQGASAQPSGIDPKTDGSQLASLDVKSPDADAKPAVTGDSPGPMKDASGGSAAATSLGPTPSGAGPGTATDGGKSGGPQIGGGGGDNPLKVPSPKGGEGVDKKAGGGSPPQTNSSGSPGGGSPLPQGGGESAGLPLGKPESGAGLKPQGGSNSAGNPLGGGTAETPINLSCPPGGCSNQMVGNTVTTGQHDNPQKLVRNEPVQPLAIPVDLPKPQPQPQPAGPVGNPPTGNSTPDPANRVLGPKESFSQLGNQAPIGTKPTDPPVPFSLTGNQGPMLPSGDKGVSPAQSGNQPTQPPNQYAASAKHEGNVDPRNLVQTFPGQEAPPLGESGKREALPQGFISGDPNRTQLKKTGGLAAKKIVDLQSLMFLDNVRSSGFKYEDKSTSHASQGPATRIKTSKIDPSLLRITKASELTITSNARLESLGVQPRTPGDGRLTARTGAVKVVPMTVTTPKANMTGSGVTAPKVNVTKTGVATPKVTITAPKIESPAARVRITEPKVAVPKVNVAPKVNVPKINAPRVSVPPVTVAPSDVRLKRDIVQIAQLASGHSIYRYRYLWDDTFYVGVLAQEIAVTAPEAIVRGVDGYLRVDYDRLGLKLMTWDEWLTAQAHAAPNAVVGPASQ